MIRPPADTVINGTSMKLKPFLFSFGIHGLGPLSVQWLAPVGLQNVAVPVQKPAYPCIPYFFTGSPETVLADQVCILGDVLVRLGETAVSRLIQRSPQGRLPLRWLASVWS